MQNEPNLIPLASPNPRNEPNLPSPRPKYSKRTQFPPPTARPAPQNMRNEPNLRTTNHQLRTKICKTNPISPNPRVIPAKWNPPRRTRGGPPNPRTTNYELYYAKRTQSPYGHGMPYPHCAKRTQLLPLFSTTPLLHYSPSPLLPFSTTPLLHYSPSPLLPFSTTPLLPGHSRPL